MGVCYMQRQDSAGFQMAEVEFQGLLRKQVDGNGIAGEGVDNQEIVMPRRFVFKGQSPVAQYDLDLAGTICEIGEFAPRHLLNERVDLVEPEDVSGPFIGGEGARAEPDDTCTER